MRFRPPFVFLTGALLGLLFILIGVPAPERPTNPSVAPQPERTAAPQGLRHPPTPGVEIQHAQAPEPTPAAEVQVGALESNELNELKLRNFGLYMRRLAATRANETQTVEPLTPEARRAAAQARVLNKVAESLARKHSS